MKRMLGVVFAAWLVSGWNPQARADDQDAKAVLDKAIKALGGEEKLGKIRAFTWTSKVTITFGDNENVLTSVSTSEGLDRYRAEVDGEFNGNPFTAVVVLDGDKGWRKFGDMVMEMDADSVANEKRTLYLQAASSLVVPLKGNGFKVESDGEEKVGDNPADVLKVTGPDGKDFRLFIDKESGLPVKQVATVAGFMGEEFTQETTYGGYKDFDGVKRATKAESKRDGMPFVVVEIQEFKVLPSTDASTFAEPK